MDKKHEHPIPSPATKYDTPGIDIRNVHELNDPIYEIRLKPQYMGGSSPLPASQLDAFELTVKPK
ncbi:MAG: hypothetical protein ACOVRN_00255 [Flavobacterium sp.]